MGQVALGFRSLLVRAAIFFVMAALLAWALGGTLFPRAEVAELFTVRAGGQECYWKLSVGGRGDDRVRWALCLRGADGRVTVVDAEDVRDVIAPSVSGGAFVYAALRSSGAWDIVRIDVEGRQHVLGDAADRLLATERVLAAAREAPAFEGDDA